MKTAREDEENGEEDTAHHLFTCFEFRTTRRATELNPAEATYWLELGDCYSPIRGHRNEALKAYTQAATAQEEELKDDPKNGPGWMILALARAKAGSPQTAPGLIEKADRVLAGDIYSKAGVLRSQVRSNG